MRLANDIVTLNSRLRTQLTSRWLHFGFISFDCLLTGPVIDWPVD